MHLLFTKRKKSAWALLLSCAMMFTLMGAPAEAVSQAELNALKQQQEQLAREKAGIQLQYDAISKEVSAQTEKLGLLNSQLEITASEIENLSAQIAIYTNAVAEMENQLNVSRQKEDELVTRYRAHVRAMEENGEYTYLSILFGATSFANLISRIDYIADIMSYDSRLIDRVREAQAETEKARSALYGEIAEQEAASAEYQKKQAELAVQQAEAKTVLESLTADSEEYEEQLESVNALQSSLSGQISDMEHQLAELARIRAEQEAARQQAESGGGGNWYGDSAGTGTGQDIVDYAKTFLGVSYVYGGTSPSGFDCSGLVYYCYKHFGYAVNRTAAGLAYNGTEVSSNDLRPGDVLLFTSQGGSYIGHTGIYMGAGLFIHAPHTGDVVKISSLSDTYYTNHYYGARRIVS